jgi:hypothetical protein
VARPMTAAEEDAQKRVTLKKPRGKPFVKGVELGQFGGHHLVPEAPQHARTHVLAEVAKVVAHRLPITGIVQRESGDDTRQIGFGFHKFQAQAQSLFAVPPRDCRRHVHERRVLQIDARRQLEHPLQHRHVLRLDGFFDFLGTAIGQLDV